MGAVIVRLLNILRTPFPMHILLYRFVLRHIKVPLARRVHDDIYQTKSHAQRPGWPWCAVTAARQARDMGYHRISIIEFGIASGQGLIALEECVQPIFREFGVQIEIYGFGLLSGLPATSDPKDVPYLYEEGFHKTDVAQVSANLKHTTLVIGDVRQTIPEFGSTYEPAPIAGIIFDLDYYTSTIGAFSIFDSAPEFRLPRIVCYFDDLEFQYSGESQAIVDFNNQTNTRAIGKKYGSSWPNMRNHPFYESIFEFHDFEHPRYGELIPARLNQRGG